MLFLETFVALLGAREVHRHNNALTAIANNGERHAWERWGRQWARVWGIGAVLIGVGGLWAPVAPVGWVVAGIAPIAAVPVPCGWGLINRHRALKSLRNLFFVSLGAVFVGHGLGLL